MTPRKPKVDKVIILWKKFGERYRTTPQKYASAKETLKGLKLPTKRIPRYILDDYPDIALLKMLDESDVIAYLRVTPLEEIDRILEAIEDLPFNRSFNTMEAYIIDANWKARHHGEKYYFCGTRGGKSGKVFRGLRYGINYNE